MADTSTPDTPMMVQFREAKEAHPDCLLFFRMGDFYEMFFDDAVVAAEALDITLTRRGKNQGNDIPMAGVPAHAYEAYLARLIRQGFKVAICDQLEEPAEARKRGGKPLVRRAVTRVVTQGTLTEDTLLDARSNNFLLAVATLAGGREWGLAYVDISTGDLLLEPTGPDRLAAALSRLEPGEVLVSERVAQEPELFETFADWKSRLTVQPNARFDSENARRRLLEQFGVATLDAFGAFSRAEVAAAGALVDYIALTQTGRLPRLAPPQLVAAGAAMEIDAATRRNLELTRTLSGDRRGGLLSVIDRTVTSGGARLLAAHLAAPLTDPEAIGRRHQAVAYLVDAVTLCGDLRRILRGSPDLERSLSRLSLGRGGPRDLASIRDALSRSAELRARLAATPAGLATPPDLIAAAATDLGDHATLVDRLARALAPEPPALLRDGGFIAAKYDEKLDEFRSLRDENKKIIVELQVRYAGAANIGSLKIRHNNVLGYYVEVSPSHADKMLRPPLSATFVHRQTLASAVRFTTTELADLERQIAEAGDKALALELSLFDDLVGEVLGRSAAIARAAQALATLDVAASQAELAVDRAYVRPEIDDGLEFSIQGGRHPVVEAVLAQAADPGTFVPNDCNLSPDRRLWLLTGPNMAGKSTFLRQNALIAVLAQMGGFVPATAARIGVVDRLFSRVGAADDLARGRSTFMVEMVEAAAILNQATDRSLVILDEIGRGTATFDGLSIAWACVEHLHAANRCRALFATHYHELTALGGTLEALSCHAMRVKEWQGAIVFLHEVVDGAADRSYGIHVARLAGLPDAVTARAEAVLAALEQGGKGTRVAAIVDDLPLFSAAAPATDASVNTEPDPIESAVREIDPDQLTPRQALDQLYALKGLIRS